MNTYTVTGTITGYGWWPRIMLTKTFTFRWRSDPPDERPDLATLVNVLLSEEDGDFESGVRLMADCVLTITKYRADRRGHRSRSFPLTLFRSLRDVVTDAWPEYAEMEA